MVFAVKEDLVQTALNHRLGVMFLRLTCCNVLVDVKRSPVSRMCEGIIAASTSLMTLFPSFTTPLSQTSAVCPQPIQMLSSLSGRLDFYRWGFHWHFICLNAPRYYPRTKFTFWAFVKLRCSTFVGGIYIVQGY